jgi:hypothetical protein
VGGVRVTVLEEEVRIIAVEADETEHSLNDRSS